MLAEMVGLNFLHVLYLKVLEMSNQDEHLDRETWMSDKFPFRSFDSRMVN